MAPRWASAPLRSSSVVLLICSIVAANSVALEATPSAVWEIASISFLKVPMV
jgi:hypothetical protein